MANNTDGDGVSKALVLLSVDDLNRITGLLEEANGNIESVLEFMTPDEQLESHLELEANSDLHTRLTNAQTNLMEFTAEVPT